MTLDIDALFRFLKELKANNNKAFMDDNRKTYEALRKEFVAFLDELLGELRSFDASLAQTTAKGCLFRINRDIRFSANKDLYKTCFSAFLAKGGNKGGGPGYYLHLEPGNHSLLAGGIYQPAPETLAKLRSHIALHHGALSKIAKAQAFKTQWGTITGERLKTAPKGYSVDHPALEWLQLKSLTVAQPLKDAALRPGLEARQLTDRFKSLYPLNSFLSEALQPSLRSHSPR